MGNLAYLKFANSFDHKVLSLFHLLIKKSEKKVAAKKFMGKQSRKVVQVTPVYGKLLTCARRISNEETLNYN